MSTTYNGSYKPGGYTDADWRAKLVVDSATETKTQLKVPAEGRVGIAHYWYSSSYPSLKGTLSATGLSSKTGTVKCGSSGDIESNTSYKYAGGTFTFDKGESSRKVTIKSSVTYMGNTSSASREYTVPALEDFTMTFKNGTSTVKTYTKYYGKSKNVTVPNAPAAATGKTFVSWKNQQTGTIRQPGETFSWAQNNNYTYSAQWKNSTYSITYNLNGGKFTTAAPNSYTYGTGLNPLPTPTKENYTFLGWYSTSDFSGSKVTYIGTSTTGNKTFYAKWKIDKVDSTISLGGWSIDGKTATCNISISGSTETPIITTNNTNLSVSYDSSKHLITVRASKPCTGEITITVPEDSSHFETVKTSSITFKKIPTSFSISSSSLNFSTGPETIKKSILITNTGEGKLSVSSDSNIVSAYLNGDKLEVTSLEKAKGEATVTLVITPSEWDNYNTTTCTVLCTCALQKTNITIHRYNKTTYTKTVEYDSSIELSSSDFKGSDTIYYTFYGFSDSLELSNPATKWVTDEIYQKDNKWIFLGSSLNLYEIYSMPEPVWPEKTTYYIEEDGNSVLFIEPTLGYSVADGYRNTVGSSTARCIPNNYFRWNLDSNPFSERTQDWSLEYRNVTLIIDLSNTDSIDSILEIPYLWSEFKELSEKDIAELKTKVHRHGYSWTGFNYNYSPDQTGFLDRVTGEIIWKQISSSNILILPNNSSVKVELHSSINNFWKPYNDELLEGTTINKKYYGIVDSNFKINSESIIDIESHLIYNQVGEPVINDYYWHNTEQNVIVWWLINENPSESPVDLNVYPAYLFSKTNIFDYFNNQKYYYTGSPVSFYPEILDTYFEISVDKENYIDVGSYTLTLKPRISNYIYWDDLSYDELKLTIKIEYEEIKIYANNISAYFNSQYLLELLANGILYDTDLNTYCIPYRAHTAIDAKFNDSDSYVNPEIVWFQELLLANRYIALNFENTEFKSFDKYPLANNYLQIFANKISKSFICTKEQKEWKYAVPYISKKYNDTVYWYKIIPYIYKNNKWNKC